MFKWTHGKSFTEQAECEAGLYQVSNTTSILLFAKSKVKVYIIHGEIWSTEFYGKAVLF